MKVVDLITRTIPFLLTLVALVSLCSAPLFAQEIGTVQLDVRIRYEAVEQENVKEDADALTLRTRLNFTTNSYSGFSGVIEFEDSRSLLGIDNYNNTNGLNTNYSVIADPETTELDQAYLQYKTDALTAKIGRQVITLDGHRFVGHVGWRQDRQTFDAVTVSYQFNKEMKAQYSYINKRNRIFANEKDLDAKDHLVNLSYTTPIGKLVGYGYLLEIDNDSANTNASNNSIDTWGISLNGSKAASDFLLGDGPQNNADGTQPSDIKFLYSVELATQSLTSATADFDVFYTKLEAGAVISGITGKIGYESLGSDDGLYGFATPLATLHKFNGWADQFLATPSVGLDDIYASLGGASFGGKWLVVYHRFSADEATQTVDDLGSEIDIQFSKTFGQYYSAGIKYAAYSAGDSEAGKVDTNKLWLWLGGSF